MVHIADPLIMLGFQNILDRTVGLCAFVLAVVLRQLGSQNFGLHLVGLVVGRSSCTSLLMRYVHDLVHRNQWHSRHVHFYALIGWDRPTVCQFAQEGKNMGNIL